MLLSFPLLTLPIIAYNVMAFLYPVSWMREVFRVTMISDVDWIFRMHDLIIAVSLFLLFFEILKATRTSSGTLLDHALSMILFVVCLVEFLLVREAATSTFFLMIMIVLIDVVAGYSVTIRGALRDMSINHPGAQL
ncbi:MAG: hypothetical protein K8F25_09500 [Fimbriimonadaceae bacterium]|nr:hypothetical protein [Alphaproteobacteria bacterium]